MRFSLFPLALIVLCLSACDGDKGASETAAAASTDPADAGMSADRVRELLEAELARRPEQVTDADLESRDPEVRRAAARALARIRGEAARDGLLHLLADEDPEVVAWAAYGLGDSCSGKRDALVSALTAARAALTARLGDAGAAGPIDPERSIIRAVGRCSGERSEEVLVGWARERGTHSIDAVHALGDVARAKKKLREETFIALLELAAGNAAQAPIAEALYPFGRVEHLPPSVIARTLEVAEKRLEGEGPSRIFAVRALARAGDEARPRLADILEAAGRFGAAERVEAARGLARLGRDGQRALAAALPKLVPAEPAKLADSADVHVTLTVLESLTEIGKARASLRALAELAPPDAASPPVRLRLSWLRCSAAKILAERDYTSPLLRGCDLAVAEEDRAKDPIAASVGARAIVAAIGVDGVKIRGARHSAWRAYATGGDRRARQAAIGLLVGHDEIADAAEVLAGALADPSPGVVAAAAEVIGKAPQRAQVAGKKGAKEVHAGVAKAILAGLEAQADLEARAALIAAAAALALPGADAPLSKLCASPYAALREPAFKALATLKGGVHKVRCEPPKPLPLPEERARAVAAPVKIKLASDVGDLELELDPSLAPVAATRLVELVGGGFFDGMVVHRVVPGFVSQLGSPTADGYGGAPGKPSLACETSPLSFEAGAVGMALAGRDTGSSQLFVTHTAQPHLDGQYALVGRAKGPWDRLIDGDVIRDAARLDQ